MKTHAYEVTFPAELDGFGGLALADANRIFSRNLQFWLKKKGMRAAELARRLGYDRSAVSNWYSGRSSPELRIEGRVAEILEVPLRELFVETGDKGRDEPRPPTDEVEEALKILARVTGYAVTLTPVKKK